MGNAINFKVKNQIFKNLERAYYSMAVDPNYITEQFNDALKVLGNLQKDMKKMSEDKQKLIEQLNETEIVKKEIDLVENGANCFKQIGPCLVKQSVKEIQQNVNKRLDLIKTSIAKADVLLKDNEGKQLNEKKKISSLQETIQKIRMSMQQQQK
eukprot:TRINITY_DN768_c0_g1_i1.p2 TRINITY_DN768_c0_g1~~TRINITY_DN768_c0_g1_i1.p2  ORF type:complete len:154 (-),score=40.87 TRINITY_DN768_c0_g1_i1:35-496(-)